MSPTPRASTPSSQSRCWCQSTSVALDLNLPKRLLEGNRSLKVAILDDYQNAALGLADWSSVASRAEITVFSDHLADPDAVVQRLLPFDVICVMRERTPLPRNVLER